MKTAKFLTLITVSVVAISLLSLGESALASPAPVSSETDAYTAISSVAASEGVDVSGLVHSTSALSPSTGGAVASGYECDLFFCTVELNKSETRDVVNNWTVEHVVTVLCAVLGKIHWAVGATCDGVVKGYIGWIQSTARDALAEDKCLGVRAARGVAASVHPAVYSGANCF